MDGETKQILNRIVMTAIDELADQLRGAIQKLVLFVTDVRDLSVLT
jgi:hypothetical protein